MNHPLNARPEQPTEQRETRHPLEQRATHPQAPPQPQSQPAPQRVTLPQSQPILAYTLLGINIAVFIADYYILGGMLTALGAKVNEAIVAGEYWRFLTPMFLHASIAHLGMNCLSLYLVGREVERLYGSRRFAAIYLMSGIAGGLFSFAMSPYPSVGASGAIFGLIGALLPFLYRNRGILLAPRQHITRILIVIGMNLVIGLTSGFIDNWAHFGGLLGGLAPGWFATPLFKIVRDEITQTIRIVDDSPRQTVWAVITVIGALIVGMAYGLAVLRSLG